MFDSLSRWLARCLSALRLIGEGHPAAISFGGFPVPRSRASER
jgi:hypothetical protein